MNKKYKFVFLSYDENENSVEIDAPNKKTALRFFEESYTFQELISCEEILLEEVDL